MDKTDAKNRAQYDIQDMILKKARCMYETEIEEKGKITKTTDKKLLKEFKEYIMWVARNTLPYLDMNIEGLYYYGEYFIDYLENVYILIESKQEQLGVKL